MKLSRETEINFKGGYLILEFWTSFGLGFRMARGECEFTFLCVNFYLNWM